MHRYPSLLAIPWIALLVTLAAPGQAALLRVPVDHPDLPTALAASADGDTVAIAASYTVAGGVVIPGRSVAVIGGWDDAFQSFGGLTPVLGDPSAPALTLAPPQSGSPLVAGLAITGGGGAELSSPVHGRYGGGILVEGGAPILRDLVITGGQVGNGGVLGLGGGLALVNSTAQVTDVIIQDCRAAWGAGIFVGGGAPQLVRCAIIDNTSTPAPGGLLAVGAGVCVRRADLLLSECEIRGGRGSVRGGGIAWLGMRGRSLELIDCDLLDNTMTQDGGGLWGELGSVTITGGLVATNQPAPDAPYTSGGGLYLTGADASLAGVTFSGNRADAGGGATINTADTADIRDSIFLANQATFFGAALNYQGNGAGEISGNTLAGNLNLETTGGALQLVASSPSVHRNLIASNTGSGVVLASGAPVFTCNNVFGHTGTAWSGLPDPTGQDGNLAVDPLFCDLPGGDLSLDAASPCLDAPAGCGQIGALGAGCGDATSVQDPGPTPAVLSLTAYPNPANPRVNLRTELPAAGPVRLTIHDARGRLVATLVQGQQPAGALSVAWDGRDQAGRAVASGVYHARLVTALGASGERVTLLR